MQAGGLVSDEIVIELVLESTKDLSKNLLLDGFPRTARQVSLDTESKLTRHTL